jgi:hypothetical protein
MKRIFISYRRTDSSTITGRIYDRLVGAFGEDRVFKDVDDIPLGQDFRKTLEDEVSKCDILCVIIGKQWANVVDEAGNRRLKDPNDFVSIEVAVGLNRPNVLVVPCLVNGATMPTAEELPPDLQALRFRNAAIIRDDPDFKHDMVRLIEQIKKAKAFGQPTVRRPGTSTSAKLALGGLGIILLVIVVALGAILPGLSPSTIATVSPTPFVTPTLLATDTPVPSATPSPEPTATPTPVEQTATTKDGAHVWPRPMAVREDKFIALPGDTEVILIGDPVSGPIVYDSDTQGDWYQVRMPDETEPLGWIYVEHVTIRSA